VGNEKLENTLADEMLDADKNKPESEFQRMKMLNF